MTKVINLFGGPGIGKSTIASGLFHLMKTNRYNVELVTEFAKDLVWQKNYTALNCQIFVTANQYYRQHVLIDKVDYIITDSPVFLGAIFSNKKSHAKMAIELFDEFCNINYFLTRDKNTYSPIGRRQSVESSCNLDNVLELELTKNYISYKKIKNKPEIIYEDLCKTYFVS